MGVLGQAGDTGLQGSGAPTVRDLGFSGDVPKVLPPPLPKGKQKQHFPTLGVSEESCKQL